MAKKKITVDVARKAFLQSVCFTKCEAVYKRAEKCVVEEGGCNAYKMFNIKINQ